MWDSNGVKSIIKSFKEDEKDGLWVWWSPSGNKVKEGSYKLGQNMASGHITMLMDQKNV